MKRYTYRDKTTGKTVTSDKPLKGDHLVLVRTVRDGSMKGSKNVRTK